MYEQLLARFGLGHAIRALFRIVFVHFLFHTLGFGGGIAVILAVIAIALFARYRLRR